MAIDREIVNLTYDEAELIIYDDHENYQEIINTIIDRGRWTLTYELIVQRLSDGKYFSIVYIDGATENQDCVEPFYDSPKLTEVFETKKEIIVYE